MAQPEITRPPAKKIEELLPEEKVGLVHTVFDSEDPGKKSKAVEVLQADEQDFRDILSGKPPREWLEKILPEGTKFDEPDDVFAAMRRVLEDAQPKRELDLPGEFDRFVEEARVDMEQKRQLAEHRPERGEDGPGAEKIMEGAEAEEE